MGSRTTQRSPLRFEHFEDRLALAAQPLADFWLDEQLETGVSHTDPSPMLADVHALSGVNYVRQQFGFRGAGQTVAIIDSGIAYDHVALGGGYGTSYRVVGGWDFTEENDSNPYDDGPAGFHGTHVAGIIASDDTDFSGVAPEVDVVALRVFNDAGQGYFQWVESALRWVHTHRHSFDNPITTVNLSIGSNWNSDSIPSWAMLEEEFQQLRADGVFISVSAGNSFATYGTTGLSYPAASPYVVPVASVDNSGGLSSFSQRHDRALAAPGRSITSTVPDHVFGADGTYDDFGTASGTSMAAPYVAGASVLVREAMEWLGYQSITQDTIYSHLRTSADLVFDTATNAYYHRLNLERALDALMPADDYGSSLDTAHSLGSLASELTFSGALGRLRDEDFFSFTATYSGQVRFSIDSSAQSTGIELVGGGGTFADGMLSFDVVAGEVYSVQVGAAEELSRYTVTAKLAPTTVQTQGDQVFVFGTSQRDSVHFVAGTKHVLTVNGVEHRFDSATYRNFSFSGAAENDRLHVSGSAGNETIILRVGSADVRGTGYRFQATDVENITVDGAGGGDFATLYDSAGNDVFHSHPTLSAVSGPGFANSVLNVEAVYANATSGGNDAAVFYDSPGNDVFAARPDHGFIEGPGYYAHAVGFDGLYAFATAGGSDVAVFYDSAGNDTFVARPESAYLQGAGFYNHAGGFDGVYAFATAGGSDVAVLYDSVGNDTFVARPESAYLQGPGFYNQAGGFDGVYAFARAGGSDVAVLYDSAGNDTFVAHPTYGYLTGAGYANRAAGFDGLYGFATAGGSDVAVLYDSPGDDVFTAVQRYGSFSGVGFYNHSRGFDGVYGYATNGGTDLAVLHDSTGSDLLIARPTYTVLEGPGMYYHVQSFETVRAYAGNGGMDRAVLYGSSGSDTLSSWKHQTSVSGHGFSYLACGFGRIEANAGTGGQDRAYFYELGRSDRCEGRGTQARVQRDAIDVVVRDFDLVRLVADDVRHFTPSMSDIDYALELVASDM